MASFTIDQQIDHVDAAILALQHCVENGDARAARGKPADPFRELTLERMHGFEAVRDTLAFVREHATTIREAIENGRRRT